MNELIYRDEDHSYWLGGKHIPSVTQLLQEQGIAPDFSNAPKEKLSKAAAHGTLVHDEIENFFNTGEEGITDEFQDFKRLIYEPLIRKGAWLCEVMVHTDDYAGRADIIVFTNDAIIFIDTKTGEVHKNSTAWQTSMYAYAYKRMNPASVFEGLKEIHICFDAKMEGKSQLIYLERVPDEAIENLVEAHKKGKIYNPCKALLKTEKSYLQAERTIARMEAELAKAKKKRDEFWAKVKAAMQEGRIQSWDTPHIHATLVDGYFRNTVDSEAL